jgi:hypothetical protein
VINQQIDQPSQVLPRSMLVDSVVYKKQLTAYVHWVAGSAELVAAHAGEQVTEDEVYQDAADVVQFEMELAKVTDNSCLFGISKAMMLSQSTGDFGVCQPKAWLLCYFRCVLVVFYKYKKSTFFISILWSLIVEP